VRVVGVAGTCVAVSTCPGVLLGVAVCAITQYTIMMISCSCAHSVVCWYQEYLQGVLVKCCFQGGPLAEHVCNACSHTGRGGGLEAAPGGVCACGQGTSPGWCRLWCQHITLPGTPQHQCTRWKSPAPPYDGGTEQVGCCAWVSGTWPCNAMPCNPWVPGWTHPRGSHEVVC
jgi:hypothetical protein